MYETKLLITTDLVYDKIVGFSSVIRPLLKDISVKAQDSSANKQEERPVWRFTCDITVIIENICLTRTQSAAKKSKLKTLFEPEDPGLVQWDGDSSDMLLNSHCPNMDSSGESLDPDADSERAGGLQIRGFTSLSVLDSLSTTQLEFLRHTPLPQDSQDTTGPGHVTRSIGQLHHTGTEQADNMTNCYYCYRGPAGAAHASHRKHGVSSSGSQSASDNIKLINGDTSQGGIIFDEACEIRQAIQPLTSHFIPLADNE
ncbi:hypothetical protein J6590_100848 [Homalodisca vitripennis]|nr:hypothetical protein J6590_100848 [Homalodisca vitripennis]